LDFIEIKNFVKSRNSQEIHMQNDPQEYISLTKATQFCNYSQEYLSLRARQGKLKAVKFGRNWLIKKEWLDEYLRRTQNIEIIETSKVFLKFPKIPTFPKIPIEFTPKIRFGFLVVLVLALLLNNIVFGKESFKNVYQDLDFAATELGKNTDLAIKGIFDSTKNIISLASEGAEITFQSLT